MNTKTEMTAHTAKNWRTAPSEAHRNNPDSIRVDILDDAGVFGPAFVAGDILPDDARMMAAAPDLLAALIEAAKFLPGFADGDDAGRTVNTMVRSAIAKAKGAPANG
jgi:hypothetical protein